MNFFIFHKGSQSRVGVYIYIYIYRVVRSLFYCSRVVVAVLRNFLYCFHTKINSANKLYSLHFTSRIIYFIRLQNTRFKTIIPEKNLRFFFFVGGDFLTDSFNSSNGTKTH